MRIAHKLLVLALLVPGFACAYADSSIRLTPFPSLGIVADGHSVVTITAEIRDQSGRGVPDGTRVVWDCPQGMFKESTTTTTGGFTHADLVAGTIPGEATITATALSGDASPTTIKYVFAADRNELSSAKEYIEVVTNGYMQYTADQRVLGAAAPSQGVSLRYRDVSMTADDLQYDLKSYEVRARNVTVTVGKTFKRTFSELFYRLKNRTGYGITTYRARRANSIVSSGIGIAFVHQDDDGKVSMAPEEDHFGLVQVTRSELYPVAGNMDSMFRFENQSNSPSSISAKKAIVFPRRMIQFQKAEIFVAGSKVMKIPLYEYNLMQATPLVTEQMLGITDSQVQVNYPYILSMRPGETALLRFRTGDAYGRSTTTDHGAFLDYELNWDRGDDMQGGLIFSGIGRNDWVIGANQYIRVDDRTSMSAQAQSPTGQSYFGNADINHQFNGFSASVNGDVTRTVQGIQYTASDYGLTLAKDPIKVGTLPLRLNLELTATGQSNQLIGQSQSGEGGRVRIQSLPLPIDPSTSLVTSFTTSYLEGRNELPGLQYLGTASLSHRFNSSTSMIFTYNYTHDGFNQDAIGQHEVTMQGFFNRGNVNFTTNVSKSLDIERSTIFNDLSYKVSKLWRIKTGYTFDNYLSTTYVDYNIGFSYRMGWREVGLIWTEQTRRIGLQLLGTSFY